MRVAIIIFVGSLAGEACYCSHGVDSDEDAGEDAPRIDVGMDARSDVGPPPTCGAPIRASGPWCADATCVLTQRFVVAAGFEHNPQIVVTASGDVLITYRGDDLLPVAVFRDGDLIETRSAPLASFGSGDMTRAGDFTYVAGREVGTNDALLSRIDDTAFVDSGLDFGDDGFGWGLTGDDAGCIHLLLSNDEGVQPWIVRDDLAWRGRSLGSVIAYGVRIGAASRAHIVTSTRRLDEERVLSWTSEEDVEQVDRASETTSYQVRFDLVGDTPHILYAKREVPGVPELIHATRDETGWQRNTLAEGEHVGCSPDDLSTRPEETCTYQRTTHHPIAVLVDQRDDVSLLYGEVIENTTLTAACGGEDRPPDACGGWVRDPTYTGSLHIVRVGESFVDEVVTTDLAAIEGRAVAEGTTIHAAIEVPLPTGRELRYVSLSVP